MSSPSDHVLLQTFVNSPDPNGPDAQVAFTTLVSRHLNFVYSVAVRQVRDRHLAEDVTQAVFLVLAKKAARISPRATLSDWLFWATRYASANLIKSLRRRRYHEYQRYRKDLAMTPTRPAPVAISDTYTWDAVAPLLDGALASLGRRDRQAVLLRYIEGKSLREVGASIHLSEEAARKRIQRAVERLREFFQRKGVSVPTAAIGTILTSATLDAAVNTLAPAALAASAGAGAALSPIARNILWAMFWSKVKIAATIAAAILVPGLTAGVVYQQLNSRIRPLVEARATNPPRQAAATLDQQLGAQQLQGAQVKAVEGTVLGFDGKALSGAEVYLASRNHLVDVYDRNRGPRLVTDKDGKFSFPRTEPPLSVVVLHADGFAMATDEQLAKLPQIPIRPWMRIEGVLKDGARPMANEQLELNVRRWMPDPAEEFISHVRYTETNREGKFVFDRVAPVDVWLVRRHANLHLLHSKWTFVPAQPGKTITAQMGGTGRPALVGKLVLPKGMEDQISFVNGAGNLAAVTARPIGPLPVPAHFNQLSRREQAKWMREWESRPAARAAPAHHQFVTWWQAVVEPDGTFSLDDLPAGKYDLIMSINEFDPDAQTVALARANNIEAPADHDAGAPGKAIELGTFQLTGYPTLRIGKPAPAFVAQTLQGQEITLADFKGKYLLLHIRSPHRADVPQQVLQTAFRAYSHHAKFAMLTIHIDVPPDEAEKWADENGALWPQATLRRENPRIGVLADEYTPRVRDGSAFGEASPLHVIDPDGNVALRSIRGDARDLEFARSALK